MPRPPHSTFRPDALSLAAFVAGTAGVIAAIGFGAPGWFLIVGLGLIFAGVAWEMSERFQNQLRQATDDVKRAARAEEDTPENKLRRDLVRLKYEPGKESAASELDHALKELESAFAEFLRLLDSRLDPGEMTHVRFAAAGADVKRAAIRSLALGVAALVKESPRAMPEGGTTRVGGARLQLAGNVSETGTSGSYAESLERNRRAVAGLKKMNEALLSMRGRAGDPEKDLQKALADLGDLAKRAGKY